MAVSKITKKKEAFIKGEKENSYETKAVILRIPSKVLQKIEEALEDRDVKVSRNTWILEAIHKYL